MLGVPITALSMSRDVDCLCQKGGRGQPLRECYDPHPGLRSQFVRLIDPLVGVPVQVQTLIMDIHVNHSAPATTGCGTSLLDEASLFA
jgi:hypothetical protein